MFSLLKELPSISTLLSIYASVSAMAMLIRTICNEVIPKPMRNYISSKVFDLASRCLSSDFTFIIEERWQAVNNETFRAVEAYLPTRIGPSTDSLLIGSNEPLNPRAPPKQSIPVDCKIIDEFQGMRLEWTLRSTDTKKYFPREKRYFRLACKKGDRDRVMQSYFPQIAKKAESILRERETLNIYTYDQESSMWESTVFKHPATFETLAMEPELKQLVKEDLDSFVARKDFFEGVGRAWKRGYLLYGPPGTGKSSLVAAIANYLRYNIYDLQVQSARSDADLRHILTSTTNRSILLIEDIDCGTKVSRDRAKVQDDQQDKEDEQPNRISSSDPGVTLSGLLNFLDGLWSSCGDERIIIVTTNHKEKLDPALLRPGRMDVHIHMGYCTPAAFRKLAATYLGIKHRSSFVTIENLLQSTTVTPAEVAQQLMKRDEPEAVLESFIHFLEAKRNENGESGAQTQKQDGKNG
ncbi:P-loop containing nucleoside triphosphate hydrolases superfamily protein [Theobroma cacao]|uniref:P-loop containing nucleoside triphosphate hydrolases superfamily protein n=1 Tax=Theobroma cacao TaxID=3641 RepID=A0A061DRG3_THECC|nr:P-loop containing nucleoside triphosphate hydrolases superfamily protein [Theobroma cacao]